MTRVAITEFRRQLGRWVNEVQTGAGPVMVVAHGKPVAALISMEHLRMVWLAEDELHKGPVEQTTGTRPGAQAWARMRRMLSRNGDRYVTEAEEATLQKEDRDAVALAEFYRKHPTPPPGPSWLELQNASFRKKK